MTSEYTDWSTSEQDPIKFRDLTAEALHDASVIAPVTATANYLSVSAKSTYYYVLHPLPDNDLEVKNSIF